MQQAVGPALGLDILDLLLAGPTRLLRLVGEPRRLLFGLVQQSHWPPPVETEVVTLRPRELHGASVTRPARRLARAPGGSPIPPGCGMGPCKHARERAPNSRAGASITPPPRTP